MGLRIWKREMEGMGISDMSDKAESVKVELEFRAKKQKSGIKRTKKVLTE